MNPGATETEISYRLATADDIPALELLIPISARTLQRRYYNDAQLDGAIGTIFGVDSQLIADGTFFVATVAACVVGCGGWSKRRTPYGGDRAKTGPDPLRDPGSEPAMIRAFFVHPDFARRGIGRALVALSERGAREAGFQAIEIVATLAGEPLYSGCGYRAVEYFDIALVNGERMPAIRMRRSEPLQ